ncbi:substrate-binding domain-containing protein [Candidatus Lokiarchaeum ossiferum]|uniref:substrate-binding domain-containing protein n=1 Tax=Candidatus Lokiarchaeum ossiferum TaxID=2951803 RepID=UPI00352D861E
MTQKKGSKNYLKQKISATVFLAWILFGFFSGSALGYLIFQNSDDDVIKLSMVYSSEKSTWISETAILFQEFWEEKRVQDSSLKKISLDFQPYGSGDSLIALLNGETKPTIWSPASNIWIPLLNAKWSQYKLTDELIVPNFTRLIYSPVVIATWEDFYAEHPFNGLNDLHDLISENPGLVNMAHTDPRSSNSGFMATIMMVSSFLNMDPELMSVENLTQEPLQSWMSELEEAAIFYGKSTGFLGKYMRDQGPDALQIAILYENLVQDYGQAAEERYGQKIIAVYPEEGALFSDHPFCILNTEWVSEDQRMVAEEYLKFIGQKEIITKAISTGFRPINTEFLNDATVHEVYSQSFNADHGVTADPSIILELQPPADGTVIGRIPDLWLLTRNSV